MIRGGGRPNGSARVVSVPDSPRIECGGVRAADENVFASRSNINPDVSLNAIEASWQARCLIYIVAILALLHSSLHQGRDGELLFLGEERDVVRCTQNA